MLFLCFDNDDAEGYHLADFFNGTELLADGQTFDERLDQSFCSPELARDWLEKSYKGRDVDGIGVLVDGTDLPDPRS